MGSRNPPPNLYDPALLERSIDATWTALEAREPFRDLEKDNELKTELSHKLNFFRCRRRDRRHRASRVGP